MASESSTSPPRSSRCCATSSPTPGEVLSQERLLEHVWDEHADPFTNTVRVTVGTLRRKLSIDDEAQVMETVIGAGYRLLSA